MPWSYQDELAIFLEEEWGINCKPADDLSHIERGQNQSEEGAKG